MLRYTIAVCFVFMGLCSIAQVFHLPDSLFLKRGHLFFEYGISIPFHDYAKAEPTQAAGYAQAGHSWKTGLQYDVLPWLGLGLHYYYNQNSFNAGTYFNDIKEESIKQGLQGIEFKKYTSNAWVLSGVMFGIYYPIRNLNNTITIGFYSGLINGILPANRLDYHDNYYNADASIVQEESYATGAAYAFHAGFRGKLYKDLTFSAKGEIVYSEQEYNQITGYLNIYTSPNPIIFSGRYTPYTQYYQIFNFTAGLAWQF